MVAVMVLLPVWLVVMVALRTAKPKSMSLMFPMRLPLAFCGPPVKTKKTLKEYFVC